MPSLIQFLPSEGPASTPAISAGSTGTASGDPFALVLDQAGAPSGTEQSSDQDSETDSVTDDSLQDEDTDAVCLRPTVDQMAAVLGLLGVPLNRPLPPPPPSPVPVSGDVASVDAPAVAAPSGPAREIAAKAPAVASLRGKPVRQSDAVSAPAIISPAPVSAAPTPPITAPVSVNPAPAPRNIKRAVDGTTQPDARELLARGAEALEYVFGGPDKTIAMVYAMVASHGAPDHSWPVAAEPGVSGKPESIRISDSPGVAVPPAAPFLTPATSGLARPTVPSAATNAGSGIPVSPATSSAAGQSAPANRRATENPPASRTDKAVQIISLFPTATAETPTQQSVQPMPASTPFATPPSARGIATTARPDALAPVDYLKPIDAPPLAPVTPVGPVPAAAALVIQPVKLPLPAAQVTANAAMLVPPATQSIVAAAPTQTEAVVDSGSETETSLVSEYDSLPTVQAGRASPSSKAIVGTHSLVARSAEKSAARQVAGNESDPSGVYSSISLRKNNFLSVGRQRVTTDDGAVGTDTANRAGTMSVDSRQFPSARPSEAIFAPTDTASAKNLTAGEASAKVAAASPAQAAETVREIRDIADGLWALERNSVEVRFHFGESDKLSVKVEYRDGEVRATFRTDSPELRDTLAREWQSQAVAATSDRPYRIVDPVFTAQPSGDSLASVGGDASRQQQRSSDQPAAQAQMPGFNFGRTERATTPSAPASARVLRPDTALHLHALA